MRIAYFPKNEGESNLFTREFQRIGLDFSIYSPSDVWLGFEETLEFGTGPELDIKDLDGPKKFNEPFTDFDLIFQRSISSWERIYGLKSVRFFFDILELVSDQIRIVNPPVSTRICQKKHLAMSTLARGGIPILPFFASTNPVRNMFITKKMMPPLMVKTLEGAGGIGVLMSPDEQVAGDIISLFYKNCDIPLLQPYKKVDHDIRVLIIGGRVAGLIKRESKLHKHNISLGGNPSPISPEDVPSSVIEYSIRSAELLSLDIAGVDILITDDGPYVLEVNPSPGFKGLSSALGKNIPREIANFLNNVSSS